LFLFSTSWCSNTNGGIPGQLTGNQVQKENYFSAATNVAYLSDANFNGNIQYSADDDGLPTTTGVEVFASGERNPFGICLHSNGHLYGTENGPNLGYVSVSLCLCSSAEICLLHHVLIVVFLFCFILRVKCLLDAELMNSSLIRKLKIEVCQKLAACCFDWKSSPF